MATITGTLIEGLNSAMVQARVNKVDVKPFAYNTYFPLKKRIGFNWKTLTNQMQGVNVAADLHAQNATIARKARPIFESAQGDIPYMAISREWNREQLRDYQTAKALAGDADASELVDYWGNDVDFCFTGPQAELEYIAWALLSNAGNLAFTLSNNATFANEFNLDYDVDANNKKYTGTNWGTSASADVIGDLVTLINSAKGMGLNPKHGFVSLNTFYKICSAEQIIKKCASLIENSIGVASKPNLQNVNAMLANEAWLNGIQLHVIDTQVTRETASGQSSANPFADDRLVLSESAILGTTQYDILASDAPMILRAERGHTVVKKYGTLEPYTEVTIGEADAIPVLDTAYRNLYVKTDGNAW